jgi:3-dehydroquinate synthase
VNLAAGKNLIGAFHQPRAVLIDPTVLETLPEREFRAGLFEALKCGIIRDKKLFEFMTRQRSKILAHDRKALQRVIMDSVRVKAGVVAADERESGLRRILNFGHTIGHALEAATGYNQLLHGEAIAWGMLAITGIARDLGLCRPHTAEEIINGILGYGKLPRPNASANGVMALLKSDKKSVAGKVHWVLPQGLGKVTISSDVPETIVSDYLESMISASLAVGHP